MITRIVGASMMFFLIIAFFLSIVGITHVSTGSEYYSFLKSVNSVYESWSVEIPNIPKVNSWNNSSADSGKNIFEAFRNFVNALIKFINLVITLVNFVIMLVNIVIGLVQIILSTIWCLKDFIIRLRELNMARTIV